VLVGEALIAGYNNWGQPRAKLLQLRVLRLGLLQDWNVGVGVFPEGERSTAASPSASAGPQSRGQRASHTSTGVSRARAWWRNALRDLFEQPTRRGPHKPLQLVMGSPWYSFGGSVSFVSKTSFWNTPRFPF
jgi:hypothetical protein